MTKEAKQKTQITKEICKQAQLMRKGGANQTEVAQLLGVNACTISRIEAAGFDFETYTVNRKDRRAKEKQKESLAKPAEEPLEGQMRMDLVAEEKQPELSDQTKMMRFEAEMTTKIVKAVTDQAIMVIMKLDQLNDTMHQIIRCMRRE